MHTDTISSLLFSLGPCVSDCLTFHVYFDITIKLTTFHIYFEYLLRCPPGLRCAGVKMAQAEQRKCSFCCTFQVNNVMSLFTQKALRHKRNLQALQKTGIPKRFKRKHK